MTDTLGPDYDRWRYDVGDHGDDLLDPDPYDDDTDYPEEVDLTQPTENEP